MTLALMILGVAAYLAVAYLAGRREFRVAVAQYPHCGGWSGTYGEWFHRCLGQAVLIGASWPLTLPLAAYCLLVERLDAARRAHAERLTAEWEREHRARSWSLRERFLKESV